MFLHSPTHSPLLRKLPTAFERHEANLVHSLQNSSFQHTLPLLEWRVVNPIVHSHPNLPPAPHPLPQPPAAPPALQTCSPSRADTAPPTCTTPSAPPPSSPSCSNQASSPSHPQPSHPSTCRRRRRHSRLLPIVSAHRATILPSSEHPSIVFTASQHQSVNSQEYTLAANQHPVKPEPPVKLVRARNCFEISSDVMQSTSSSYQLYTSST